eukprot:6139793-Prorocentrum_lima.AAC.1
MTSSLVGSEMCIRDRFVGRLGSPSSLEHDPACSAAPNSQFLPVWSSGPVSYTHLTLPTICSV